MAEQNERERQQQDAERAAAAASHAREQQEGAKEFAPEENKARGANQYTHGRNDDRGRKE